MTRARHRGRSRCRITCRCLRRAKLTSAGTAPSAQARDIERRFGVGPDEHVFFASPGQTPKCRLDHRKCRAGRYGGAPHTAARRCRTRELRKHFRASVERRQRSRRSELALETRHAVVVSRHGGETRVVDRSREPRVVARIAAPACLERLVVELEAAELTVLRNPHVGGRQPRGIQFRQSRARLAQQRNELDLAVASTPRRRRSRAPHRGREPAADPRFLDHARERLVELAVAGDVETLVRKLMEDRADEARVPPAEHRAEQRVREVAQRRVRRHAFDRRVVAPGRELPRHRLGAGSLK